MVLVVGATGLVGSSVCERLARRGEKVRALIRGTSSNKKITALQSCGVELRVGDLKDPDSIAAACRGINAVISTFKREHAPESALLTQFQEATDSM